MGRAGDFPDSPSTGVLVVVAACVSVGSCRRCAGHTNDGAVEHVAVFQGREMASEEAVLGSQQLAIRFSEDGYEFMTLSGDEWLPLDEDPLLRARSLPEGMELELELEDNPPPSLVSEDSDLPQVFLLSSGEMTPFIVTLSAPESEQRFVVRANLLGQLELE